MESSFMVSLPLVCYAFDADSNRFQFSESPNPAGGVPPQALRAYWDYPILMAQDCISFSQRMIKSIYP